MSALAQEDWPDAPSATAPPSKGFYDALAKAQGAFQPIRRDKTVSVRTKAGGTYSFSYAPLEAILRATLPALNKEDFALVQRVEEDHLVTTLYHGQGQLHGSIKILVSDSGPQAYGSALTYARRYGVTLLLGICADDDDDGNAAEGNHVTVQRPDGLPSGDGAHGLPNISPHGDDYKNEDQTKAQKMAQEFRDALKAKNEIKIWKLHEQCNFEQTFYIAVNAYMSPEERREAKAIIDRMGKVKDGAAHRTAG